MANLSLIGCINCMGLEKNLNVKYVVELATGEVKHLKNIFNNGDIHME